MLNLKKTAIAVLALGSSAAFAGTMGPVCTAGNVTVPCERTAWDIGVHALYLQPSYSDDAAFIGAFVAPGAVPTSRYVELDPDWAWGFKLEGSYHFNTGNDFNLNWYHLGNKTTTETYTGLVSPLALIADSGTITHRLKPQWDAVNLEFGQHVDFAELKNIRLHAGVQYARIKTEQTAAGLTPASIIDTGGTFYGSETSKYNGFGPRVGADMNYGFGNGLGVYANAAAAILAGTSKMNTSLATASTSLITGLPSFGFVTSSSRTTIVPEVEATLGVNYTFAMAQGDLTLDVGYMWANYFNAQDVLGLVSPVSSDFGLNGLIFGAKWVGTVV